MAIKYRLLVGILAASLLWFFMFSPWTNGLFNFWLEMTGSAAILTAISLSFGSRLPGFTLKQVIVGAAIALALWGVFWIGDKISSYMFNFARGQVNDVYSMKNGSSPAVVACLLLFVIGPAEEFFWRGFVQRLFVEVSGGEKKGANIAFFATALIYALVHIWSFNFMLVMAALVAGAVWGFIYRIRPDLLPALIVSHALWDALVFVILPI